MRNNFENRSVKPKMSIVLCNRENGKFTRYSFNIDEFNAKTVDLKLMSASKLKIPTEEIGNQLEKQHISLRAVPHSNGEQWDRRGEGFTCTTFQEKNLERSKSTISFPLSEMGNVSTFICDYMIPADLLMTS